MQNDIFAVQNSRAIQTDSSMTALVMGDGAYSRGLADTLKEEQVFKQVTLCQSAGAVPYSAKGAYVIARLKEEGKNE